MQQTNMMSKRIQPKFLGSVVFILGLAIVNLLIIMLNDYFHSKGLMFFGNVISIGLLFPYTLLYIDQKQKFNWKKYLSFSVQTMIAVGIITYMFVMRF
ncbi:hypothetical protein D1B17_00750 [Companilactobacillus zhachilii]|uniref:Uncharacterized protein n=1 Tax=Companilactobacillus zhachilii TaxID=2304606 RepID=A0A386PQV1_9LACO|nr:hypothetical protein [Companilactobacillus zhachilii]AYE37265.2 hypothetical protein D1B17_00750 [Companilactobacillus zhachilii]